MIIIYDVNIFYAVKKYIKYGCRSVQFGSLFFFFASLLLPIILVTITEEKYKCSNIYIFRLIYRSIANIFNMKKKRKNDKKTKLIFIWNYERRWV